MSNQFCPQCGQRTNGVGHACFAGLPVGLGFTWPSTFEQRVESRLMSIEATLRSLLPNTHSQLDRERQEWEILRNAMNARNGRLQTRVEALEAMIEEVLRRDAHDGFQDSLGAQTRLQLREHLEAKVIGGA